MTQREKDRAKKDAIDIKIKQLRKEEYDIWDLGTGSDEEKEQRNSLKDHQARLKRESQNLFSAMQSNSISLEKKLDTTQKEIVAYENQLKNLQDDKEKEINAQEINTQLEIKRVELAEWQERFVVAREKETLEAKQKREDNKRELAENKYTLIFLFLGIPIVMYFIGALYMGYFFIALSLLFVFVLLSSSQATGSMNGMMFVPVLVLGGIGTMLILISSIF